MFFFGGGHEKTITITLILMFSSIGREVEVSNKFNQTTNQEYVHYQNLKIKDGGL